jgi:hypothetical protein
VQGRRMRIAVAPAARAPPARRTSRGGHRGLQLILQPFDRPGAGPTARTFPGIVADDARPGPRTPPV